jgi:hypothetical protein
MELLNLCGLDGYIIEVNAAEFSVVMSNGLTGCYGVADAARVSPI